MANYDFGSPREIINNTGITGIFTSTSLVTDFLPYTGAYYDLNFDVQNATAAAVDMTSDTTFVSDFHQHSVNSMTVLNGDDAYFEVNPSFDVYFDGVNYGSFYVGTNGYITFGGYSTSYSNLSASSPNFNKVMISAQDLHVYSYGIEEFGTTPNRVIMVSVDGFKYGDTTRTFRWHFKMYENAQDRMDLYIERNDNYSVTSPMSTGTALSPGLNQMTFTTLNNISFTPTTSLARVTSPYTPNNYSNLGASSAMHSVRPVLRGKIGQLWPRGVYNK